MSMLSPLALWLPIVSAGQVPDGPATDPSNPAPPTTAQPYFNGLGLRGGAGVDPAPRGLGSFHATLHFEELTGDPAAASLASIGAEFARQTFADRWLLDALETRFGKDRLKRLEFVDQLTGHPIGDAISLRRVRRIEGDGKLDAAHDATQFIERFLRANDLLLSAEITIYSKPAGEKAEVRVAALDRDRLTATREELAGMEKMDLVSAPTLSLACGQEANVSIRADEKYIKDYEVLTRDGREWACPIVGTLPGGIDLSIQAIVDPDTRCVRSSLSIVIREVARPIRQFKTKLSNQEEVQFDLPEWTTTEWSSTDLETSEEVPGFVITGLRGGVKTGDAKSWEPRDLWIVGAIRPLLPQSEIPPAATPNSLVLGFDPAIRRIFVKRAHGFDASRRIYSVSRLDKGLVGTASLVDSIGDLLIFELANGEAAAGDQVR